MKTLCISCFLGLFISSTSAQKVTLSGFVKEKNSGAPIGDVYIGCPGLVNKTKTDGNGFYLLEFTNGKVGGDLVSLTVEKTGYSIVDADALNQILLPNDPNYRFIVFMIEKSRRITEIATTEANIRTFLNTQTKIILNSIDSLNISQKKFNGYERKVFKDSISHLNDKLKQLDIAFRLSNETAKNLSVFDLRKASQPGAISDSLFRINDIEGAYQSLNEMEMHRRADNAKLAKVMADSLLDQAITDYFRKALYCTALGRFEEAEHIYEQAVNLDTTNIRATWKFAVFLANENRHDKAIIYYKKAQRLAKTDVLQAIFKNNIGTSYRAKKEYKKAERYLTEALEIRQRLALDDPKSFETALGSTQNNLGNLYRDIKEYDKSEAALNAALVIRQRLALGDPKSYEPDLALTLTNLGNLFRDIANFGKVKKDYNLDRSETVLKQSLQIWERLVLDDPQIFNRDLATTLNSIGNLYFDKKKYKQAEEAFIKSLNIRRYLAKNNPKTYHALVADVQNNLGNLYAILNDFDKAEVSSLEALRIREYLFETDSQSYEPDVAKSLKNVANLYVRFKRYAQAEEFFLDAFEIRNKEAEAEPIIYEVERISLLKDMRAYYIKWIDSLNTEELKTPLRKRLLSVYINYANAYKTKASLSNESADYGTLAWYNIFAQKYDEAETTALRGLAMDPTNEWININLGHAYLFQGKYKKATKIYKEYKNKLYSGERTFREVILQDFLDLEKSSIIIPNVDEIRLILKKK